MRFWFVCGLLILSCLGCDRLDEVRRRKAAENNLKQIDEALKNYNMAYEPDSEFSHEILAETEYYTTGPQQADPPDGKFSAGTKVRVVEESGSYLFVHSEGGIEAYVATEAVKKPENANEDDSGGD